MDSITFPALFQIIEMLIHVNRGENWALVGAIPLCVEYPGPQFENQFRSASQMDGISKAGGDKMAAS